MKQERHQHQDEGLCTSCQSIRPGIRFSWGDKIQGFFCSEKCLAKGMKRYEPDPKDGQS